MERRTKQDCRPSQLVFQAGSFLASAHPHCLSLACSLSLWPRSFLVSAAERLLGSPEKGYLHPTAEFWTLLLLLSFTQVTFCDSEGQVNGNMTSARALGCWRLELSHHAVGKPKQPTERHTGSGETGLLAHIPS